ncbi:helix-turn-helix transcriptional regulator [Atlantibacter subterraneus]|uniref:helix-turn-helix transcriptional regulator n=1 Tax=Atlantibacter subterraneus TaxID=255519 RepID=UPI00296486A7|nr:LuxR C-terminal-related transcriptional regulator [Atlantibacter subterranea]MDW2741726.1 LuxR C-terminal-related transcriptional regulator [Atlantibacter subterranea]
MHIIINENDALFYSGLTHLLNDIFCHQVYTPCYSREINKSTVETADIIIQSLRPGEAFLCYPALYYRKPSLMIGLVDDNDRADHYPLPLCANDRIIISRKAGTENIRRTLKQAWAKLQTDAEKARKPHCYGCKHRTMTSQQKRVAASFIEGCSVRHIAGKLALNSKSVFAHKHSLMRKFQLKNDHQLMMFLQIQRVKQSIIKHVGE